MCYFMCSAYHLLSYFLGNIYFWWELPIYCLTIPPHSWTHDQYESIKIFLWVCDKIWRGKAFFPLWSWSCKNLGFLESHGVRQSLERTVLDTERSRNERWCACSWACASPTSALSIISGHKRECCSFMFYFVYASSHWTSDTFKEKSSDQFTSYSEVCMSTTTWTSNKFKKYPGEWKNWILRLKEACLNPIHSSQLVRFIELSLWEQFIRN